MQTTNPYITQSLQSDAAPIQVVSPGQHGYLSRGRRTENAFDEATTTCRI